MALSYLQILKLMTQFPPPDPLLWLLLSSNVISTERPSRISHLSPTLLSPLYCPQGSVTLWNHCNDLSPGLWSSPYILLGLGSLRVAASVLLTVFPLRPRTAPGTELPLTMHWEQF